MQQRPFWTIIEDTPRTSSPSNVYTIITDTIIERETL